MFDLKMFYTKTITTKEEGEMIKVLDTNIPIDRSIVPESLYVYHLISKIKQNHYMVSDTPDTEDYKTTIISHKELKLGETVRLDTEPWSVPITMTQYKIETVGHPVVYVSGWFADKRMYEQDTKDFRILLSRYLNRSPEDVGVILSKLTTCHSIDNYVIELKRMNSCTHILDLTTPYGVPIKDSELAHVLAETGIALKKYPLQKDKVFSIHSDETRMAMKNLKRFTGFSASSYNTFTPFYPGSPLIQQPRFDEYGNIAIDEDEE